MAFQPFSRRSILFVRWGTPESADVERVLDLARTVRLREGRVRFVSNVPADAPPPGPKALHYMVQRFPALVSLCVEVHQVFEGEGFAVGFKRSVLTGMVMAVNQLPRLSRRVQVRVHASLDEVVASCDEPDKAEVEMAVVAYRAWCEREVRHAS